MAVDKYHLSQRETAIKAWLDRSSFYSADSIKLMSPLKIINASVVTRQEPTALFPWQLLKAADHLTLG